ncbi:MAG: hypothetical protein IKI29_05910 [Clostridia bacterium]|nr:hypothetical protein [Clostridia bacterium]
MTTKFRKSVFGFNCKDVEEYFIHENTLHEQKINDLHDEIHALNQSVQDITAERDSMQKSLEDFQRQYHEIERLAENIGKLYLVAQSNAKEIMLRSAESSFLSKKEVEKNLSCVEQTQISLQELKNSLEETSRSFHQQMDEMLSSIAKTKEKIEENQAVEQNAKDQFSDVFELLER